MKRTSTLIWWLLLSFLVTSCTRSASLPPQPTVERNSTLQSPLTETEAVPTVDQLGTLQAQFDAVSTQVAVLSQPTEEITPEPPPTPQLVLEDVRLEIFGQEKFDAAIWAVSHEVIKLCNEDPDRFCPNDVATRGVVTVAVGRMCLAEPLGRPVGYFSDLPVKVPDGLTEAARRQVEEEVRIAAISEELVIRGLYLWQQPARRDLSFFKSSITQMDAQAWIKLALDSPKCGLAPLPSPTAGK